MFPFTLLFDMVIFRRNWLAYVITLSSVVLFMLFVLFSVMGTGKRGYGVRDFGSEIGAMTGLGQGEARSLLRAILPPNPPGWLGRDYLRGDGEIITAGAAALGRSARLRAGGDLERFGLYAAAGPHAAAWVYVRGDQRIAIGMKRPLAMPGQGGPATDEAGVSAGDMPFLRRDPGLPDSVVPMPYELYRAETAQGLVIELFSNAPTETVEALLAGVGSAHR